MCDDLTCVNMSEQQLSRMTFNWDIPGFLEIGNWHILFLMCNDCVLMLGTNLNSEHIVS